jgi:ATP-binding cassette subfamily B protein
MISLALKGLIDAALSRAGGPTAWFALATAALLAAELSLGHFGHLLYFELGEEEERGLNREIIDLVNGTAGVEHLDSHEFADTLVLVRENLRRTRAIVESVLQLGGLLVQAAVSIVILGLLNPWLTLLPVAALPALLISRRAQALVDGAEEQVAREIRRGRHLLGLATTVGSIRELRLYGAQRRLLGLHHRDWAAASRTMARAGARAAALRALGQLLFAAAYGGAIALVAAQALHGGSGIGDMILVISLAAQVGSQVSSALTVLGSVQSAGRTFERLDWLRARSELSRRPAATGCAPRRLTGGIRFERVAFTYPGTDRPVLEDFDLEIPAGSTVALVGENGAGKSTLVKLLCGLYRPTRGRILVDGRDLAELDPAGWAQRIAPLFQDFARLELLLRENVGIGAVDAIGDDEALRAALAAADARAVLERVPNGLDGLLGHAYGDGAELSGGQWQKLGLARALIRPDPLLLILDEPAAALDASAEHAVFSRFTEAAARRGVADGAITLFISHRYSTVRDADLIVVLDGGRIRELGNHEELLTLDGTYADLYRLQASVYQ